LDYRLKNDLAIMLRDVARQGTAILVATHDHNWANSFTDRVLYLQHGSIVDIADDKNPGEERLEVWPGQV
jgi:ABC-type ATPase involved in cell division